MYSILCFCHREGFEALARAVDLQILVWRDVPRDSSSLGSMARATQPVIRQVFVVPSNTGLSKEEVALKMFILRKVGRIKLGLPNAFSAVGSMLKF
jgi:glutamate synthase domain-containing protein 1